MEDANIVPFGKYKGQPVEVLLADKNYSEWAASQPDIEKRYTWLVNLIRGVSTEASETPEHNAIQAQFLNDDFIIKRFSKTQDVSVKFREFETKGWDVAFVIEQGYSRKQYYVEIKPEVGDDYPAILRQMKRNQEDPILVDQKRRGLLYGFRSTMLEGTLVLYTKKI